MHEAGIALTLLETAERALADRPAARVLRLVVRVGELAGVSAGALDFAFTCLRPGTRLDGASLVIESVPLALDCEACGRRTSVENLVFLCGACGSPRGRIATGRELELHSLEIAEEDPPRD